MMPNLLNALMVAGCLLIFAWVAYVSQHQVGVDPPAKPVSLVMPPPPAPHYTTIDALLRQSLADALRHDQLRAYAQLYGRE